MLRTCSVKIKTTASVVLPRHIKIHTKMESRKDAKSINIDWVIFGWLGLLFYFYFQILQNKHSKSHLKWWLPKKLSLSLEKRLGYFLRACPYLSLSCTGAQVFLCMYVPRNTERNYPELGHISPGDSIVLCQVPITADTSCGRRGSQPTSTSDQLATNLGAPHDLHRFYNLLERCTEFRKAFILRNIILV